MKRSEADALGRVARTGQSRRPRPSLGSLSCANRSGGRPSVDTPLVVANELPRLTGEDVWPRQMAALISLVSC